MDGSNKILEVGHGNGSYLLLVLQENGNVVFYACDCSMVSLERAREMVDVVTGIAGTCKFHAFYCDLSLEIFPSWLCLKRSVYETLHGSITHRPQRRFYWGNRILVCPKILSSSLLLIL